MLDNRVCAHSVERAQPARSVTPDPDSRLAEDPTPPMDTRVAVLVPNYNGIDLLPALIESVLAQSYPDWHLIVVDDASTDGSLALLAERWPTVRVLAQPANRGFAASVNSGLRTVSAEYVAILNSDVELEPDWLQRLVETLDRYPDAGSATGKTLLYGNRAVIDGAGNQMRWSGAATRRGHGSADCGQYDSPTEVISACAGFALYRRAAFDTVGGFDEDLVAYYEDVDWGLRAQLAGWRCRYEPRAVAYHIGGATHGSASRYLRLQRRNQLLVVVKCFPLAALLVRWPQILLGQIVLLARGTAGGCASIQVLAILDAARAAPGFVRKRALVAQTRTVGMAQLDEVMTPERCTEAVARARAAWAPRYRSLRRLTRLRQR